MNNIVFAAGAVLIGRARVLLVGVRARQANGRGQVLSTTILVTAMVAGHLCSQSFFQGRKNPHVASQETDMYQYNKARV